MAFEFDAATARPDGEFDPSTATPVKPRGAIRALADLGLGVASGVTGVSGVVADAAGADNATSRMIGKANEAVQSGLSDDAKASQRRISTIMDEAKGKGTWEGVKAGGRAFAEAPGQFAAQAAGSALPFVAATLAGPVAGPLLAGGLGVAAGAGTAKRSAFDNVKQRSMDAGMSDADATAAATRAQEYGGENTDQIALGGVLGAADALTGVSRLGGGALRRALGKPAAVGQAGSQHGAIRRTAMGVAEEAPLEALQGGQEQLAGNIASQRAGFNVDTMEGVASNATLEALASAGPGAALGLVNKAPTAQAAPSTAFDPSTAVPEAEIPVSAPTQSQAMGIDPNAGPISAAAAIAVDGGAAEVVQRQQAEQAAVEAAKKVKKPGASPPSGEPQSQPAGDMLAPQPVTGTTPLQSGLDALPLQPADGQHQLQSEPVAPQESIRPSDAPTVAGPVAEAPVDQVAVEPKQSPLTQANDTAAPTPEDAGTESSGSGGAVAKASQASPIVQPPASIGKSLTGTDPATLVGKPENGLQKAIRERREAKALESDSKTTPSQPPEKPSVTQAAKPEQVPSQRPESAAKNGAAPVDASGIAGKPADAPAVEAVAQGAKPPGGAAPVIDTAAHAAATSPRNDLPEPTDAQKKAGNYPKGHVKLAGMDLSIENPAESARSGKDRDGKAWTNTLKHHYGYIKGTIGNDKDHVDAFVKPDTPLDYAGTVYVVDQVHPDTGRFDEHKVLIGFDNPVQARAAYQANYAKGWKGLKAISALPMAEFKTWVYDGPKNRPLAPVRVESSPLDEKNRKAEQEVQSSPAAPTPEATRREQSLPVQGSSVEKSSPDVTPAPADPAAGKWFGTKEKADEKLKSLGLAETHEVVRNGLKFEFRKKEAQPESTSGNQRQPNVNQTSTGRGPTVIVNKLGPDGLTDAERAAGKKPYNDAPATPQVKTDKAEIRPYRKPDGSIGYEAVPIVDAKAKPADDLNAMFDDVLGEELAKDAKKAARPPGLAKMQDARDARAPAAPRTAPAAVASAAKNVASGLTNAIDGLGALFGGKGRLGSGLSFDEDTYAKAKPLFQAAIANLKDAGGDLREAMRTVIRMVLDKFGADTAKNMQPYVVRFIGDVQAQTLETPPEKADTAPNGAPDDSGTQGQGGKTLEDVPTDEVGGIDAGRPGRPGTDQRSPAGGSADSADDAGRGETGRSGGGRSTGTDLPATGDGRPGRGRGAGGGRSGGRVSAKRGASDVGLPAGSDGTGSEERVAPAAVPAANFEIDADLQLGSGGEAVKYSDNLAAIRTLKQIESEHRRATASEKRILARYVGWGGLPNAFRNPVTGAFKEEWKSRIEELESLMTPKELKAARASTPNAHYTSQTVVDFMWRAAQRIGFGGGLVLESSVGSGNFIGLMPKDLRSGTRVTGVELDSITARIAGALYPRSTIIESGFDKLPVPENVFDMAIGNPPFGSISLRFQYNPKINGKSIHNQFFLASLDAVKPEGIQVMVVSRFLMDAKTTESREALAFKAELLGAIRLPGSAFKGNAGTSVVTDILFLRKRSIADEGRLRAASMQRGAKVPPGESYKDREARREEQRYFEDQMAWTKTGEVKDPLGGDPMTVSQYYVDNPHMIAGVMDRSGSQQHDNDLDVKLPAAQLPDKLDELMRFLPTVQSVTPDAATQKRTDEMHEALGESLKIMASGREVGSIYYDEAGDLVEIIERIAENGRSVVTKMRITAQSPWSSQLAQNMEGKWFKEVVKLNDKGEKVKIGRRNVMVREVFKDESEIPPMLRLGEKRLAQLKGLIAIRELYVQQINLETNAAQPVVMESNRAKLRAAYEAFVAEHGYLNDPNNATIISEMPDEGLILSLELKYRAAVTPAKSKRTGMAVAPARAEPNAILTRAVSIQPARRDAAASASDAVAIVLGETGRISVPRVAELRGITEDEAIAELTSGENPLAYLDPETNELTEKNQYLSGNVRSKLEAAKDAGLPVNIKALEAIQPEPWGSDKVTARLGATWIPPEIYSEFVTHLLGTDGRVTFSRETNVFDVRGDMDTTNATSKWGTGRVPAPDLLRMILNSQRVAVYDTTRESRTLNETETQSANDKKAELVEEFDGWIFKDADRRQMLTKKFNDLYNTRVNRQYDGSHMTFPGKVPDDIIKFRRNQINAVWRGIVDRFTMYDHAVGAGKTFTGIARAIERRRMGLSRKPMIVVPNHLVAEWGTQAYRLYPGAKILAAGVKDLDPKNRRRLFAKIAAGDWDVVIVPHSSFKFIGIAPETEERFLDDELRVAQKALEEAEAEMEPGERFKPLSVKAAEALIKKLETRMDLVRGKMGKDSLLTFEQLGVDDLTVDESHEFKNLTYTSRLTDVRGLGPATGSQKAFDLYTKMRILHENGGSGLFMSGTPISNSAVEMYTIMRYLAPEILREHGLEHFDAYRAQFVDATEKMEPTEAGNSLKIVNRLGRSWSNMRALMDGYYSVADVVTNEDIQAWYAEDNPGKEFPLPKVKGGKRRVVKVEPTPTQQAQLDAVVAGYNSLPNMQDVMERNKERLRLMTRARKVSLHAKVLDPRAEDEPGSKLHAAVDEAMRIYKKWSADSGTQLFFLDRSVPKSKGDNKVIKEYDDLRAKLAQAQADGDEEGQRKAIDALEKYDSDEIAELRAAQDGGWNAYQHMADMLVARGVPKDEIAFIQNYTSDAEKKALFEAVNEGSIRFLFGSSQRMGAGMNVQERLVALHHIDVGWKPSDIEQREGRIIRQGNALWEKYGPSFEVEIMAYVTARSIDAKMWDLNSTKLRMVNGIRYYDGEFEMDFEDDDAIDMAEIAAIASGDPLMLERIKLNTIIEDLFRKRRAYNRRRESAEDSLRSAERDIERIPGEIALAKSLVQPATEVISRAKYDQSKRSVVVNDERYGDLLVARAALQAIISSQKNGDSKAPFTVEIDGTEYKSEDKAEDALAEKLGDVVPFFGEVDGKHVIRRTVVGRKMREMIGDTFVEMPNWQPVGTVYGLPLSMRADTRFGNYVYARVDLKHVDGVEPITTSAEITPDKHKRGTPVPVNTVYLRSAIERLGDTLQRLTTPDFSYNERRLKEARESIPGFKEALTEKFKHSDELDKAISKLDEVEKELAARTAGPSDGGSYPPGTYLVTNDKGETEASPRNLSADDIQQLLSHGWKIEAAGGNTAFAREGGRGVSMDDAYAIRDAVREAMPTAPPIHILESVDQAPKKLRADIEKAGAENDVDAALHYGEIYIFPGHIDSIERLAFVLAHHEIRHYGFRAMLGPKAGPIFLAIHATNPSVRAAAAEQVAKGYAKSRVLAVEEALADMPVEELVKLNGFDRIIAALREFLRSVASSLRRKGMAGLADAIDPKVWTDKDVAALIARAEGVSRGGSAKYRTPGTVFAEGAKPDQTQTAAFKKWFGKSAVVDKDGKPLVVYHGTARGNFASFADNADHFFTDDLTVARSYLNSKDYSGPSDFLPHGVRDKADLTRLGYSFYRHSGKWRVSSGESSTRDALAGRDFESEDQAVKEAIDIAASTGGDRQFSGVYQVHLSIQRPLAINAKGKFWNNVDDLDSSIRDIFENLDRNKYDGLIVKNVRDYGNSNNPNDLKHTVYVVDKPTQIKSATDNRGTFDAANPDIRFARSTITGQTANPPNIFASAKSLSDITERIKSATTKIGTVSLWDKTVGTQYNKSTKDADFKRVFDGFYQQTDDTAHYAIEAERHAPGVLMRLESLGDVWKGLMQSGSKQKADLAAVSKALFANIEGVEGVKQVEYDDRNLRDLFSLNPRQIEIYRQVRTAVNTSIDRLAQTYAAQFGQQQGMDIGGLKNMSLEDTVDAVKRKIREDHDEAVAKAKLRASVAAEDKGQVSKEQAKAAKDALAAQLLAMAKATDALTKRLDLMQEHATFLRENAYMPALRFGEYAVTVTQEDADGENETLHFEMFESQMAANLAAMRLRKEYPQADISKSILNKQQYEMFKGVSPETVALFAKFTGADQNEAVQNYIALAKSSRSVLMRQLKRKGVAGFSQDATRVLASFVTSNARQAAINMNQGAISDALASKALARKGDVQREAQKLAQYMNNPLEEARRLRGFMFMHFMGGSVASALVNMTQPVMMTSPYLSQFVGAKTAGIMLSSARMAASGKIANAQLRDAAARAAEDGITEPHEIHQLMADAGSSGLGNNLRSRAAIKAWGSFFSLAEAFNRRVTFIAAYQVAQSKNMPNPYEFARIAVIETQGLYGKVNRPNWARGAVGATLFTFKQFSIAWIEFLNRLPRKQKLLALGILVLAAGLQGLPFAEDVEDLIDTIGQSLGYNTNSKKALRKFLIDNLGQDLGSILDSGIFTQTAVDVQGRLGMGNLIPGTSIFKPSETNKEQTMSELVGPLGGILAAAQKALGAAQRGDLVDAGKEMLPVAAKNFAKGLDMLTTGIYKDTRGYKVADVTAAESFMKMLGLQPGTIAEKTRKMSDQWQDKSMVTMMESQIADTWAKGIFDKDPDQVARARKTLAEWNERNPDSRIQIGFPQIRRRVQQMNQTREQRFVKTVPKELRAGVARELAQ